MARALQKVKNIHEETKLLHSYKKKRVISKGYAILITSLTTSLRSGWEKKVLLSIEFLV